MEARSRQEYVPTRMAAGLRDFARPGLPLARQSALPSNHPGSAAMSRLLPLALLFGFASSAIAAEPARPNVVFILADDLGINDLGCYGRKDHATPNLDRLATQGLRFTSAYCAQPICSP